MIFYDYILPLIVTIIGVIGYVVFFTIKYKEAPEEIKMKPIKWLYVLLVITEVLKIFYLIHQNGEFRPLRYPLVFCSTVFYTVPLFMFKTKISEFGKISTVYLCIVSFVLFAAIQWMYKMSLIQGHSYFFHGAMMAIAVYMITSKIYKFDKKKFYDMFIFLAGYVTFAAILSLYIGEDISLFGPSSSYLGFIFNTFGYFTGIFILHILFYLVCYGIFNLIGLFVKEEKIEEEVKNV
ncbi:MAG: hypothetical protein IKJ30_04065 [Bacilli bacterium]|nr:hypothetical protein [Bacilli bacterium]